MLLQKKSRREALYEKLPFSNLVAVCAHNHSKTHTFVVTEGLENAQGHRGLLMFGHSVSYHSRVTKPAFSSPVWNVNPDKRHLSLGWSHKNLFLHWMGDLQVNISPSCLCQTSGLCTETCRNCEKLLLSQVLRFLFSFFQIVTVSHWRQDFHWPEERSKAGRKRNRVVYILIIFSLNNFCQVDFFFLFFIVLEVLVIFVCFVMFYFAVVLS